MKIKHIFHIKVMLKVIIHSEALLHLQNQLKKEKMKLQKLWKKKKMNFMILLLLKKIF